METCDIGGLDPDLRLKCTDVPSLPGGLSQDLLATPPAICKTYMSHLYLHLDSISH